MAANQNFHKNKGFSKAHLVRRSILIREKSLLQHHFDFLQCTIRGNKLICKGAFQPTALSQKYSYEVIYDARLVPRVYVRYPKIEYNDDIHMFPKDDSLCLYHPETDDFYWNNFSHNLYSTIIPWTQEWFVFYELYLITGKWQHPFRPHMNKTNES